MDEQKQRDTRDREDREGVGQDIYEGPHIGFNEIDESEDPMRLGAQVRSHPARAAHVNLTQEEYTPAEAARLLGTSVEVVTRAIYEGELKAERQGRDIICICRPDLLDWMRRRGQGM